MVLSVALCTFNGEKYLKEQLDSIINQSYQVDEIIINDDASNDNTKRILKDYASKYPDLISIYENKCNLKTIKNFEKAISLTRGDLIFLADQDDIWKKNKVEIVVDYYKNINQFNLLFTNGELINENGNRINSTLWDEWAFTRDKRKLWLNNDEAYKELVLNRNKITGATVCFNKSLKEKALPILIPSGYWHDAWLGIHAAAENGLFFLEEKLILYRIHENQQVGVSKNSKLNAEQNISNKISTNEFFFLLSKLYPGKKHLLPTFKKKMLIQSLLYSLRSKLRTMFLKRTLNDLN